MLEDELKLKGKKARDTEIVINTFGIDKTKSCVSFAKASSVKSGSNPFAHNDRSENEKNYIIGSDDHQSNEFDKHALYAEKFYKELRVESEVNYRKTVGQKMKVKQGNDHWEAVINLKRTNTLISKGMTKKVLSQIQTKTAEILGMERGKISSRAIRLTLKRYRSVADEKETVKQKYKQQIKTLENQYKEAREALKKYRCGNK